VTSKSILGLFANNFIAASGVCEMPVGSIKATTRVEVALWKPIGFWSVCEGMSEKAARKARVERVAELAMRLGGKHLAD
jgi:hypothetical protein